MDEARRRAAMAPPPRWTTVIAGLRHVFAGRAKLVAASDLERDQAVEMPGADGAERRADIQPPLAATSRPSRTVSAQPAHSANPLPPTCPRIAVAGQPSSNAVGAVSKRQEAVQHQHCAAFATSCAAASAKRPPPQSCCSVRKHKPPLVRPLHQATAACTASFRRQR